MKQNAKHINWTSVEAMYAGTAFTLKEIAAAHGSSISTVHRHVKTRGLRRGEHLAGEQDGSATASQISSALPEIAQIDLLAASIDIAEVVRNTMEQMEFHRVSPAEAKAYLRNSLRDCLG